MKKMFYITFFFVLLFNMGVVKAEKCDDEDMARLKGLAGGVNYNSNFIGDRDDSDDLQLYEVSFVGITDELYIGDSERSFKVTRDGEIINLSSGVTYLEIYSKYCRDLRLKSIKIDLPKFNSYSTLEECEGLQDSDFEECNPWYQGVVSNSFYDDVADYRKQSGKSEDEEEKFNVKDYFFEHKYIFIGVGVVILFIVIISIVVSNRKNRLD